MQYGRLVTWLFVHFAIENQNHKKPCTVLMLYLAQGIYRSYSVQNVHVYDMIPAVSKEYNKLSPPPPHPLRMGILGHQTLEPANTSLYSFALQ